MFQRFVNWARNFMMGRRGVDQFTMALYAAWVVLAVLGSLFLRSSTTVALILRLSATACAVYGIFRTLSKNISARDRENAAFLKVWTRIKSWFRGLSRRWRDRKTHVYIKCSGCGAELRVPKGKGKLIVTCPKCKQEIRVTT